MTLLDRFENEGRVWVRGALSEAELSVFDTNSALGAKAGKRLTNSPDFQNAILKSNGLSQAITNLDSFAKPVRVVAFNKSPDTNWGVPWHQDRVISLAERHELDGYKNWSNKAGTWHCEPPFDVLDKMLFVRIHLDDTDGNNGAMQIAVGSHKAGIIPSTQTEAMALQYPIEICSGQRGDVLILKMLTLHCSKPSNVSKPRRALRVDYASQKLPTPLQWKSH